MRNVCVMRNDAPICYMRGTPTPDAISKNRYNYSI